MSKEYSVKLKTIVEEHQLEVINASGDYEHALIYTSDINRPGLQLTGFYDYFDPKRIQIIGKVENTFLEGRTSEERRQGFEMLMERKISALVICHGMDFLPECLEMAKKYDINLLKTDMDTSEFSAQLIGTLRSHLAPRETWHGVL